MAETTGRVARRRVAGKGIGSDRIDGERSGSEGIDGKGSGSEGIGGEGIGSARIDDKGVDTAPQKTAPERVTSTTHVNVALPFAKLQVHEPSEHLLALTTLVQDLAGLLARAAPSPEAEDLLRRAEGLAAKIR